MKKILFAALTALLFVGCGDDDSTGSPATPTTQPYSYSVYISDIQRTLDMKTWSYVSTVRDTMFRFCEVEYTVSGPGKPQTRYDARVDGYGQEHAIQWTSDSIGQVTVTVSAMPHDEPNLEYNNWQVMDMDSTYRFYVAVHATVRQGSAQVNRDFTRTKGHKGVEWFNDYSPWQQSFEVPFSKESLQREQ